MIKKIATFVVSMIILSSLFSGCSSFQETYKPLYQVKPKIEKIEG